MLKSLFKPQILRSFPETWGVSKSAGYPDKSSEVLNAETGIYSNKSLESPEWCSQSFLLAQQTSALNLFVEKVQEGT